MDLGVAFGMKVQWGRIRMSAPRSHTPSHRQDHASPLQATLERARSCLLDRQMPDGHWVGELQGDTILESEYILLMAFLGREKEERVAKAARYISDQQLSEGGWNNYPDGPVEVSV